MTPAETPIHEVKDDYFSTINSSKDEDEKATNHRDEFIDRRALMRRKYPYDTQRATPPLQSSHTVNVVPFNSSTRSKSRIIPASISRIFNDK